MHEVSFLRSQISPRALTFLNLVLEMIEDRSVRLTSLDAIGSQKVHKLKKQIGQKNIVFFEKIRVISLSWSIPEIEEVLTGCTPLPLMCFGRQNVHTVLVGFHRQSSAYVFVVA